MSWSDRYIGIPWCREDRGARGTHCWGLVRLVYAERLDIELEDFGAAGDRASNAGTIADRRKRWPWREVRAQELQPYDVIIFRCGRIDDHCGIAVLPGLMLHVSIGHAAVVDEIGHPLWRHRIVGRHRHVSRMEGEDV